MEATFSEMFLGLTLAIGLLVFLVLYTKVHPFPALIIAGLVAGVVWGPRLMP